MMKTVEETDALISSIRNRGEAEEDSARAAALISLIPYAGGVVASIIRDTANQRRTEKLCDVLSDLNSRLEQYGSDPEKHLSKDQIIEVVHETLRTVATASDEKKIEALKAGLGYAFLSDDTFERKQLFLEVLRRCTSIELLLLPVLYDTNDPYIVHEGDPRPTSPATGWADLGMLDSTNIQRDVPTGDWKAIANKEECGKESLLTFLSSRIAVDEGATEGALRLLDGNGLTNAGPNLHRSDCKVLQWRESRSSYMIPTYISSTTGTIPSLTVKPTPLESSRTKFGNEFLRFCRG